jgi:hypothetical protein
VTIVLLILATVLVAAVAFIIFVVAVRHVGRSAVNIGDDRMFVPSN